MMYFWGRSTDKTDYMSKASSKVRFKYEIQIEKPPKVKICKKQKKVTLTTKILLTF